jgi:hypothetical protein
MDLFSLRLFIDQRNGVLLRLIECIESLKSEVKRKMTFACASDLYTKVTRAGVAQSLKKVCMQPRHNNAGNVSPRGTVNPLDRCFSLQPVYGVSILDLHP